MKQTKMLLFSLAMLAMLYTVGCSNTTNGNPSESPDSTTSATEDILVNDDFPESSGPTSFTTAEGVSVDYATDAFLSEYGSSINEYIEFEEEGYQRIIFTTTTIVKDFKFIEVSFNEASNQLLYFEKDVLFSLDELSPEKPFVVTWMEWGTIPHRGISFLDENGTTRRFYISVSGKDGSFRLLEF